MPISIYCPRISYYPFASSHLISLIVLVTNPQQTPPHLCFHSLLQRQACHALRPSENDDLLLSSIDGPMLRSLNKGLNKNMD